MKTPQQKQAFVYAYGIPMMMIGSIVMGVLAVLANAAFWGLVVYVAWHFISKFW